MHPQFEETIKIEHLQGYLYSQQAISNTVSFSPGSMYEYAITELDTTQFSGELKLALSELFLDRLKGNTTITTTEIKSLHQKSTLNQVSNWETTLQKDLEKWFIDAYLYINPPRNYYEKMVNPTWPTKQKNQFIENGYKNLAKTNDRLKEHRPASKYFIYLIQLLLNNKDIEVFKFSFSKSYNKQYAHYIDLYWGMEFDLFVIRNSQRTLLLHLGDVLT